MSKKTKTNRTQDEYLEPSAPDIARVNRALRTMWVDGFLYDWTHTYLKRVWLRALPGNPASLGVVVEEALPPTAPQPYSHVACFDCQATNLEHFYTSKDGGYHLCQACFEARQAGGRAREANV